MELNEEQKARQRVVCAANRHIYSKVIVLGARHYDEVMRTQMNFSGGSESWKGSEQGFIDQWGNFLTREEALEIAEKQGQIREKHGNKNMLFSEDLY